MKRFIYTAALCVGLALATTSVAQPPGGGRPGIVPPKQQGSSSGDLERKLDRLDAQLKSLEGKLAGMKAPETRVPEAPKAPGGDRSRFGPSNRPGPGGFGNFGRGPGTPAGGTGFGTARRDGGSNPDFEKRLDKIIEELEQLKKDLKGGPRGGGR